MTEAEEKAYRHRVYEAAKRMSLDPDYRVMLQYFESLQVKNVAALGREAGTLPAQVAITALAMLHTASHLFEQTQAFVKLYEEGLQVAGQKTVAESAV